MIGVERSTGYNIMKDYKRAKTDHSDFRNVAATLNIDLAERRNADLVGLLVAPPYLSRTSHLENREAAVFAKAQENVAAFKEEREEKARLSAEAETQKTNYIKLLDFTAKVYEGKATVAEFRKDMDAVSKHMTSYLCSEEMMPSKRGADERNLSKA